MTGAWPVRVLSWQGHWGKTFLAEVIGPFAETAGIPVVSVPHVGLKLPDALLSALAAGEAPPVDVVWSNTVPALRAASRGWCEPLHGLDELDALRPRAGCGIGPDWPIAQAYVIPYVLVYRTALYPGSPPDTWRILLNPDHAGRVVAYPGANGLYPVAQVLGGGAVAAIPGDMAPCWSVLRRLRAHMAPPSYSIGLEKVIAAGEVDILYRALPNALGFKEAGLAVGWTVPEEGCADTTDCLWIPRGLSDARRRAGMAFVAFALSPKIQERWCAALGALPMHRSAAVPESVRRCGLSEDMEHTALYVPESIKAAYESTFEAAFDAIMGGG